MNTIFHGTGIYCLANIALEGRLRKSTHWGKWNEPDGVRLTTDYAVATSFIAVSAWWGEGGVLIFDRDHLDRQHRLKPYADTFYAGGMMQCEHEIVIEQPEISLIDGLVSIACDVGHIHTAADHEWMRFAMEEGGWPFEANDAGMARCAEALQALQAHPALNVILPTGVPPQMSNWPVDQPSSTNEEVAAPAMA